MDETAFLLNRNPGLLWPWRCLILSPELPCCRITNYHAYPSNCNRHGMQGTTRLGGLRTTAWSKFNFRGPGKHLVPGTPAPGSGKPNEHLHLRVMMVRGIVLNSFFVFIFVNLVLRLRSGLRGLRTRPQAMQSSLSTVPGPSNLILQLAPTEDLQYQLEKWLPATTSSTEWIATSFSRKEGTMPSLEHDGILRRMD